MGIVDNLIELNMPMYGEACLGKALSKLTELGDLKDVLDKVPKLFENGRLCKDKNNSLYLDRLDARREFLNKELKYRELKSNGPFVTSEQNILSHLRCLIDATYRAKVS